MREYDEVKAHYENAAHNRYERLRSGALNAASANHAVRYRTIDTLLRKVGHFRDGIDIGTGTGVWAEVLCRYCQRAMGIDFAETNIEIARRSADKKGLGKRLSYMLGDAQTLEGLENCSYDVAMQISVLQHLPNRQKSLNRVNEILRESGVFIILVHNQRCIYNRNLNSQRKQGTAPAINEYVTLGEVLCLLKDAGFRVEEVRLCWPFVNDLLLLGLGKRALVPFMPMRKTMLAFGGAISNALSRVQWLNPFFREIVILARKQAM